MAFRKKSEIMTSFFHDIVILQECEILEKIPNQEKVNSSLWIGHNQNKGLAVFAFNNYELKINPLYNEAYRYIIPIDIFFNKEKQFTLFAVWTMNDSINREQRYIGQVVYALKEYESLLNDKTIIIGDFNWNKIWDMRKKKLNFADLLTITDSYNIKSLYHFYFNEVFGAEVLSTLFLQKNIKKPYHIDYCFAGSYWHEKLKNVDVGKPEKWLSKSDHMPLLFEFS
ncbi:endonuclease/exonuclease/phosphatase family protein [Sulfurospirillum cavolei]|uniref:endonuclease/exonuclease/phosphatase family protein n=1 Tax=Sulfurospirillum cavolei TaxID=366522 RepID=UPI0018CD009C|nr:endonuclease/exonuclease/phosphatase family protein [Sulfurospirillum cavolei]